MILNQKGIAPVVILVVVAVIGVLSIAIVRNTNRTTSIPSPTPKSIEASPSASVVTSATPKPTPKVSKKPTATPVKTPTPSASATTSTATPTPTSTTSTQSSTSTQTTAKKPACNVTFNPSGLGTAPFQASVCIGNTSDPFQQVDLEYVDFEGDGTWDYSGPKYGCHPYTYNTPGLYKAKGKIHSPENGDSDVCEAYIAAN
jgi:hypothetical protein